MNGARLLRRFYVALLVPVLLIVGGTAGYQVIEGWSVLDALYMTVITLGTVGYGETHPLSPHGRAFTIVLILGGVFAFFYAVTEFIRAIVTGEVQMLLATRRMERSLRAMDNHVIVCGFGRMGRFICKELAHMGTPFVVIERDPPDPPNVPAHGTLLPGDATSDDVLARAGVKRAKALVASLAHDADNLYITMSARLMNDKLFIIARAEEDHATQKFERAGANRVVSPYALGGHRMAQAVLRPAVTDFLELTLKTEHLDLQFEEVSIGASSRLVGTTLAGSRVRAELGIIIVAMKRPSGEMLFNPPPETEMRAADVLITLGPRHQLDALEKLAE